MSTKANWGDIYAEKNKSTVDMGGKEIWYVKTPLNIELTFVGFEAESRAKQICALPKMVEFIKHCAEDLYNETGERMDEMNWAERILREIGEIGA